MKHGEEERKMPKQVKAVINHNFKHPWVIVNQNTGEILDDAQGYGYRTAQKAHAAWSYKHRSDKSVRNHKLAQQWWRKHKEFARDLNEEAFEIAKGSWGPDDKFDLTLFKENLQDEKIDTENIPIRTLFSVYLSGKF